MILRDRLVQFAHARRGWRLWTIATTIAVVLIVFVVAALDWLIKGRIEGLDLLVGAVATGVFSPLVMSVLHGLLNEARLRDQANLTILAEVAEDRLATALEVTRLICWEADLQTGRLEYAGSHLKVLGVSTADPPVTLEQWLQRTHPDDRERLRDRIDHVITHRGALIDIEYRFDAGNGSYRWLHSRSRGTEWSAGGHATRATGTTMDITERKQAETEIEAGHELLRTTLQSTDEGILVIAADGRVLTYNQSFLSLWRIPAEMAARGDDKTMLDHVLDQLVDPAGFLARVNSLYGSDAESRDTLTFKDGRVFTRYSRPLQVYRAGARIWCFKDVTDQRRSENALRESERKLLTILDNVDAFIYLKDVQGRYLFANRSVRELWGKSLDEIIGQGDEAFFDAGSAARIRANDAEVLTEGRTLRVEETNTVPASGKTAVFQSTKLPLRNPDGAIYALCGISIDITARKAAENELQRHRDQLELLVEERTAAWMATELRATQILNSSADGLLGIDLHGRITFVNRAACDILCRTKEELTGVQAHPLFHHSHEDGTPYPEDECPMQRAVRHGVETRVDDEVFFCPDGRTVPIMYAVHPTFRDGVPNGAVVSFVDVRVQRAAAAARERALAAAEDLARVRREFLANMSHEIRTPLNGVLGFAQIGLRHADDVGKSRNAFEKILLAGKTLLGVVDEVLDFSRVEAGKVAVLQQRVDLRSLIADAVDIVRERAAAKHLALEVDIDPDLPEICLGDDQRLEQVLLNLLSNAVKFTETGRVVVSAGRDGDELVFAVEDTGIGIDDDALVHLFNPFHQADASTTRRFGGTGLGLAISKRIVELMNGSVRVTSKVGVGSCFEFRIPYLPVPEGTSAHVEEGGLPSGTPLAGYRILAVEDDAINSTVLEENLVELGADVVMVASGADALGKLGQRGADAFDVVLMDVQMPGMDGYAATRALHAIAPALPVIGQTAHAFDDERQRCFGAGMADHVAKPIRPAELVAKIRRHAAPGRRIAAN